MFGSNRRVNFIIWTTSEKRTENWKWWRKKKIFCTLSQKSIKSFSPTTQIKWAIYWVSSSVCAVSYSRISGKIDVIMRTKYARNANQLMSERKNIKIACPWSLLIGCTLHNNMNSNYVNFLAKIPNKNFFKVNWTIVLSMYIRTMVQYGYVAIKVDSKTWVSLNWMADFFFSIEYDVSPVIHHFEYRYLRFLQKNILAALNNERFV